MAKDLLEKLGDYRQKRVMDLSDQQVIRLQKSLQELENLVIKEASKIDPTRGSLKLRTTVALQMRPKLKQYIEQTYLNAVQQNISEYDKSASWLVGTFKKYPIPDEFKEITELDLTTIQQLKRGAYLPFEDLGSEFVNELSQEVYNSTLTGKPTEQMIADLRGKINGVYQSTDNEEAQELVDFIANNPDKTEVVKTATERLQTIYGRDRLGNNFRRYATQLVQDSLMGFDGQFAKYRADELGLTHYVYTGTTVRDSRDFCRRNVGKIYSEEEIRDIWSSQSWNGKAQGDPFIVRGGYNCRHHWQPTDPEWGKEDDDFPTTEDIEQQDQKETEPESRINITSIVNPITLANIRTVPKAVSQARLNKSIQDGAKDSRWRRKTNGTFVERFKGGEKYGDKITIPSSVTDKELTFVSVLFDELNELSTKYNVPKLRGLRITESKRFQMTMGDGVLTINSNYLTRTINNIEKDPKKNPSFISNWKYGDNFKDLPKFSSAYTTNLLDSMRNTIYHEFGHHIHQMKYVTSTTKDKLGRLYGERGFVPEIEDKIQKILKAERKKLPPKQFISKNITIGNSEYGNTNYEEWFAEQFAVYTVGKLDKVHPAFKTLIKEIEDEVGR
jgi:hypothetical protein